MIIKPRIRGFICTAAHPEGCAAHVREQIDYVRAQGSVDCGARNVLVLGASGGYGLASRIVTAFAGGAGTLGVSFEKAPAENRTATAGWYNNIAFEEAARDAGNENSRDEDRGQNERDGHDRTGDLLHRLERGVARAHPLLDVVLDGFDHHDGIIDDEADG